MSQELFQGEIIAQKLLLVLGIYFSHPCMRTCDSRIRLVSNKQRTTISVEIYPSSRDF